MSRTDPRSITFAFKATVALHRASKKMSAFPRSELIHPAWAVCVQSSRDRHIHYACYFPRRSKVAFKNASMERQAAGDPKSQGALC